MRGTGALSVSSVKTLRNLLGTSPEWFAPAPVVSPAIDGGFMALEVGLFSPKHVLFDIIVDVFTTVTATGNRNHGSLVHRDIASCRATNTMASLSVKKRGVKWRCLHTVV